MHRVKIEPNGTPETGMFYNVLLDGKEIRAKSLNVKMDADCVPEIDIDLLGEPDAEIYGYVGIQFTAKTVKSAAEVLKKALMADDFIAYMAMNDLMQIMENK